jgi:hypothetical protein
MLFEKFDRRDVLGNFRASTSAATNVTDYEVMFNGALPEAVMTARTSGRIQVRNQRRSKWRKK